LCYVFAVLFGFGIICCFCGKFSLSVLRVNEVYVILLLKLQEIDRDLWALSYY